MVYNYIGLLPTQALSSKSTNASLANGFLRRSLRSYGALTSRG